jgi:hypothetical protein
MSSSSILIFASFTIKNSVAMNRDWTRASFIAFLFCGSVRFQTQTLMVVFVIGTLMLLLGPIEMNSRPGCGDHSGIHNWLYPCSRPCFDSRACGDSRFHSCSCSCSCSCSDSCSGSDGDDDDEDEDDSFFFINPYIRWPLHNHRVLLVETIQK